jgi:hypothetical protein
MGTRLQGRKRAAGLMILGVLALGCAKGPSFSYDVPPGVALERYHTVALDPRRDIMVPATGKRAVEPREFKGLVTAALEAKGFRVVPAEEAELWVDVFVLTPGQGEGRAAGAGGGHKGGRGKRGGLGEGGSGTARGGGLPPSGEHGPSGDQPLGSQELSVVVELVERQEGRMVWLGVLDLPRPEKGAELASAFLREQSVKQLLSPLASPKP